VTEGLPGPNAGTSHIWHACCFVMTGHNKLRGVREMAKASKKMQVVVQLSPVHLYTRIKGTQPRFGDRKPKRSPIPPVRNGVS
jgi:hypothetical protein